MVDIPARLPRPLSRLFLPGMVGFWALYLFWLFWGREDPAERFLVSNVTLLFTALVVLAAALWIRARTTGFGLRRSWNWLCAGVAFWALGDLARLLLETPKATHKLSSSSFDLLPLFGSISFCVDF